MSETSSVETSSSPLPALPPVRPVAGVGSGDSVFASPAPIERSTWIGFAVLLASSILLVGSVFLQIWKPLLMAAVLAGTFAGLHDRLAQRLRQRRAISAAIFTLGVVVLLLIPLVVVIVIGVQQTIAAVTFVREALESGGMRELISALPDALQPSATWIFEALQSRTSDLQSQAASGGQFALSLVRGAVSITSGAIFRVVLCLIAFFALLTDGQRLMAWIEETSPLGRKRMGELFREFRLVSRSVIGSMVASASVQALAATMGYWISGVPQPAFFGLLTFFSAFIPSIGTGIVAVPIAGLLLLLGKTFAGIFLLAWSVLVVGLVDNLIKPLLMKGQLHVHAAIVFFSLVGGIVLFGLMGLVVGPLAIAFFLTMVRLGQRDFT